MRELLRFFSTFTRLPVQVNDIADHIRERGIQDEIIFRPTNVDPNIFRGALWRYIRRDAVYGDPVCVSQVIYAASLCHCWRRFVCAKELVHIMDPPADVTATRAATSQLLSEIVLPLDVQTIPRLAGHTIADHMAELTALGLLLPMEVRNELLPAFVQGRIDAAEIAGRAQIPERYVQIAMADWWPTILGQLYPGL